MKNYHTSDNFTIEEQMKLLNDIMAEQSEFTSSDVGFEDYSFEE